MHHTSEVGTLSRNWSFANMCCKRSKIPFLNDENKFHFQCHGKKSPDSNASVFHYFLTRQTNLEHCSLQIRIVYASQRKGRAEDSNSVFSLLKPSHHWCIGLSTMSSSSSTMTTRTTTHTRLHASTLLAAKTNTVRPSLVHRRDNLPQTQCRTLQIL